MLSFRSRSMNRCSSPRRQTWPSAEPPAAHCPARPAEPLVSAAGRWAPPAGSAARADCAPRRPRKPRGAPVPRPPLQPAPLARRRDEPSGSRRRRVGPVTAARRTPPAARGEGEGRGASSGTTCSVSRGFVATSFLHQLGKMEQLPPRRAETSSRRRGSARSREASRALDAPREARGRAGGRRVRAVPGCGHARRRPPPAGAPSAPGPRAGTQAKDTLSRRPQADHQTPPSGSTALAVTGPPARGQGADGADGRGSKSCTRAVLPGRAKTPASRRRTASRHRRSQLWGREETGRRCACR